MESARTTTTSRTAVGIGPAQYEYRQVTFDPGTSRAQTRTLLTEQAEYGRWELARTLLYAGGKRRVWLRRKIIRVRSTL